MKLLITTDFHDSRSALAGLDILLDRTQYDAVIMLGDLINPRPSEMPYVHDFIDLVMKKHQLPLYGLHGNNEPEEAWRYYREVGINIHLENRQLGEYNICGIGGLGFLNETGFEDLSVADLRMDDKTIFVTHIPPQRLERSVGGPFLHLFGHRHVLAYTKQLGDTLQVQCPAGILGRVTELELPSKTVRFLDLPKI